MKLTQYQRIPAGITASANRKAAAKASNANGIDALNTGDDIFTIMPNPTIDKTIIAFNMNDKGRIVISDMLGNNIKTVELQKDQETYTLETSNLAQGVYFVTLFENDTKLSTRKLVVNK